MSKLHIKKVTRYLSTQVRIKENRRVLEVLVKRTVLWWRVNIISKHTKPNAQNPNGGIEKKEAPVHISKLNPLDPKTGNLPV